MKLNSLFTGRIGRPEGRKKILGPNPPMTNFVTKKKKHFVTVEIFLYVVGNPLGSMNKKSLRTGRFGKCRKFAIEHKKNIFCDDRFFFHWNKIVSNQSFPKQIKPKLQNIVRKVPRFLNEMSYEVWDQQILHIYVPIASKTVFIFGNLLTKPPFWKRLPLNHNQFHKKGSHSKYFRASCQREKSIMNNVQ